MSFSNLPHSGSTITFKTIERHGNISSCTESRRMSNCLEIVTGVTILCAQDPGGNLYIRKIQATDLFQHQCKDLVSRSPTTTLRILNTMTGKSRTSLWVPDKPPETSTDRLGYAPECPVYARCLPCFSEHAAKLLGGNQATRDIQLALILLHARVVISTRAWVGDDSSLRLHYDDSIIQALDHTKRLHMQLYSCLPFFCSFPNIMQVR